MLVELSLGWVFYIKTERSFDEPALKATFASTLIIPSNMTALSNMPVQSEKPVSDGKKKGKGPIGDDLKRVEFETTPIMSTYVSLNHVRTDFIAPCVCHWRFRVHWNFYGECAVLWQANPCSRLHYERTYQTRSICFRKCRQDRRLFQ